MEKLWPGSGTQCGPRWRVSHPGLARSVFLPLTAKDRQVGLALVIQNEWMQTCSIFSEETDALRDVLWDQWLCLDRGGAILWQKMRLHVAVPQVNMKDYAQFKSTFVKPKQSKAIANAIEEIEKYCKGLFSAPWSNESSTFNVFFSQKEGVNQLHPRAPSGTGWATTTMKRSLISSYLGRHLQQR